MDIKKAIAAKELTASFEFAPHGVSFMGQRYHSFPNLPEVTPLALAPLSPGFRNMLLGKSKAGPLKKNSTVEIR